MGASIKRQCNQCGRRSLPVIDGMIVAHVKHDGEPCSSAPRVKPTTEPELYLD